MAEHGTPLTALKQLKHQREIITLYLSIVDIITHQYSDAMQKKQQKIFSSLVHFVDRYNHRQWHHIFGLTNTPDKYKPHPLLCQKFYRLYIKAISEQRTKFTLQFI